MARETRGIEFSHTTGFYSSSPAQRTIQESLACYGRMPSESYVADMEEKLGKFMADCFSGKCFQYSTRSQEMG